jgi:hypothetical protein
MPATARHKPPKAPRRTAETQAVIDSANRMTAIELYRLMDQHVHRDVETKTHRTVRGDGMSDFQRETIRGWLLHPDNRPIIDQPGSAVMLYNAMAIHASGQHNRVGDVAAGTIKKMFNLLNGREPYYGQQTRPSDWDEVLDGPWVPGEAPKSASAVLAQQPKNNPPSAPTPITTTGPMAEDGITPSPVGQSGPQQNIVQQVLKPAPTEGHFDLGPKDIATGQPTSTTSAEVTAAVAPGRSSRSRGSRAK